MLSERDFEIETSDGRMPCMVCSPQGGGVWPAVIMLMDAGGMREELRIMARELAVKGYCVALPNLFYRGGVTPWTPEFDIEDSPHRKKLLGIYAQFTNQMAMVDVGAVLEQLAREPAARQGPVGVFGFCMSGPFALVAAARFPDRIAAAGSVHGVRLVTAAEDSPHRLAPKMRAEIYVAWAEFDRGAPLTQLPPFREAMEQAGVKHDIEVMAGAEHGFIFPRRTIHRADASARVWEKLDTLFRQRVAAPSVVVK